MATTRDFISLGVWAEDAQTTIPSEPTPGIAYRNEGVTEQDNEDGEAFQTKANSANVNQKMFIISSFTDTIDTHGIPGWSEDVDYDVPAIVWGDDGEFYYAIQASGPSTLPRDPTGSPAYWFRYSSELVGQEGTRFIGHTGFNLASMIPFAGARVDTNGVLLSTFNVASSIKNSTGDFTINFTNTQPDNGYYTQITCDAQNLTLQPYSVVVRNQTPTSMRYFVFLSTTGNAIDCDVAIHCYPSGAL